MTEIVMDGAYKGKICEMRINSKGKKSIWGPENSCWTDKPFNPESCWKKSQGSSRNLEQPPKKIVAWKTSAPENTVGSILKSNRLYNLTFEM